MAHTFYPTKVPATCTWYTHVYKYICIYMYIHVYNIYLWQSTHHSTAKEEVVLVHIDLIGIFHYLDTHLE